MGRGSWVAVLAGAALALHAGCVSAQVITPSPLNYANSSAWPYKFTLDDNACGAGPQGGFTCRHGRCDDSLEFGKAVCVCEEGWTGLSDFVNGENVHCFISETGVLTLWIINFVAAVAAFAVTFPRLRDLWAKYQATKRRFAQKGKPYGLTDNPGLLAVIIFYIFSAGFNLATGLVRVGMKDTQRVGQTWLITVFWMISRNGFYVSQSLHQPALLSYMLRAQNATSRVVRASKRRGFLITGWSILNGFWVVPILVDGGQNVNLARACFVAFVVGQVIGFLMLCVQAKWLGRNLHRILSESLKANKSQGVILLRDKLDLIQESAFKGALVQTVLFLFVACFPFLYTMHDYILPISWIGPTVIGMKLTKSIHTTKTKGNVATTSVATNAHSKERSPRHRDVAVGEDEAIDDVDTAIMSEDLTSVVQVESTSPELLAAGTEWSIQSAARKALRWRSSKKVPAPAAVNLKQQGEAQVSTFAEQGIADDDE